VSNLKITQKRSVIGWPKDQRATVRGLGLRRIGHTVELENTPSVRGMVKKVIHLVTVQEPGA
jgi:large subunit ribosomal protein L30